MARAARFARDRPLRKERDSVKYSQPCDFFRAFRIGGTLLVLWPSLSVAQFDAYESDPFRYCSAPTDDPVSRLQRRLDEGKVRLEFDGRQGYLAAVLRELGIPA